MWNPDEEDLHITTFETGYELLSKVRAGLAETGMDFYLTADSFDGAVSADEQAVSLFHDTVDEGEFDGYVKAWNRFLYFMNANKMKLWGNLYLTDEDDFAVKKVVLGENDTRLIDGVVTFSDCTKYEEA